MDLRQAAEGRIRKRKADNHQANDQLHRVSKRLRQLNLELNGKKLDLPTDDAPTKAPKPRSPRRAGPEGDSMQVDNTPHRVYIYNLDDELSDSDSSADENKVVFLPDVDKRLRASRIPPAVLANSDGELAGRNLQTDLVLYNVPASLSVPEGQDSVRKAIIEARARARDKQRRDQERARTAYADFSNGAMGLKQSVGLVAAREVAAVQGETVEETMDDPDAMDID